MSLRDQLLTADTPAEIADVLDQYVRNEIVRTQTNATTGLPELLGPDGVIPVAQWNAAGTALVDPVSGGLIGLVPASYTWAGKPAASSSNAGQSIRITDVGNSASGSLWQSDGTIWRPVNGRVLLGSDFGSLAAPIATISGVTSGGFVLPLENPSIPANLLPVGARININVMLRRRGANATASWSTRLGVNGGAGDQQVLNLSTSASDSKDYSANLSLGITSSGSFTTQGWLAPQASGTSAIADKVNAAIDTTAEMFVSFDIFNANVSDSFDLISYSVSLEF